MTARQQCQSVSCDVGAIGPLGKNNCTFDALSILPQRHHKMLFAVATLLRDLIHGACCSEAGPLEVAWKRSYLGLANPAPRNLFRSHLRP